MLYVTNRNGQFYKDRFDGEDYEFPPGEKVLIEELAAAHIFGFGRADKTENLIRMGKANAPDGPQWLARFQFTAAKVVEDAPEIPGLEEAVEKAKVDVGAIVDAVVGSAAEKAAPTTAAEETGGKTSLLDGITSFVGGRPSQRK